MKKKMFMTVLICGCMWGYSTLAQAQVNPEDMLARRAEKMAENLGIKEEGKADFIEKYKTYQQELMTARMAGIDPASLRKEAKTDGLTDEEATQRIQAKFDREAQQIVNAYNALEVEKKYYAEFAKTLTPQQLVKIFVPERQERNRRPSMGGSNRGNRPQRGVQGGGFPRGGWENDAFGEE